MNLKTEERTMSEERIYWELILKPLGLQLTGWSGKETCIAITPKGSTFQINSRDVAETIRKALYNE